MLIINLYILLVTMTCCQDNDKIDVTGIAVDCKYSAGIVSGPDSVLYYLDGVDHWKSNAVGKKVRVQGKHIVKNFPPPKKDELIKQTIIGDSVHFILAPKWELVK